MKVKKSTKKTTRLERLALANAAKRTRGRPPGARNKTTILVREGIALAFQRIGGLAELVRWAKKNRTLFYTKIWPLLLPIQVRTEVTGAQGGPIEHLHAKIDLNELLDQISLNARREMLTIMRRGSVKEVPLLAANGEGNGDGDQKEAEVPAGVPAGQ